MNTFEIVQHVLVLCMCSCIIISAVSLKIGSKIMILINIAFALPFLVVLNSLILSNILNSHSITAILSLFLGILTIAFDKNRLKLYFLIAAVILAASSLLIYQYSNNNNLIHIASFCLVSSYLVYLHYFCVSPVIKLHEIIRQQEIKIHKLNHHLEFEVKKRTLEIEQSNRHLINMTKHEKLSQTLNKNAILSITSDYITAKKRFSILLFDIDNFKEINDTHGHVEGDKCIRRIGRTTNISIRDIDHAGRYGGDEFLVVLPDTDPVDAMYIAERIRKNIETSGIPSLTVSIGIACYPDDAKTLNELLIFADDGLYISKKKGRNATTHKNLY